VPDQGNPLAAGSFVPPSWCACDTQREGKQSGEESLLADEKKKERVRADRLGHGSCGGLLGARVTPLPALRHPQR
jgi:hypothetical protein